MLLKRLFFLLVWGCTLASCAKNKSNELINEANFIKVQSLNTKILFLQKVINAEGVALNKVPYPYSVDFASEQGQQLVSISQPPPDCNIIGNQWLKSKSSLHYIFHSGISTVMGCSYTNNLENYYIFPNEFLFSFENENIVIVTDVQKNSKAYFQLISDRSQLPNYNEPPMVSEDP